MSQIPPNRPQHFGYPQQFQLRPNKTNPWKWVLITLAIVFAVLFAVCGLGIYGFYAFLKADTANPQNITCQWFTAQCPGNWMITDESDPTPMHASFYLNDDFSATARINIYPSTETLEDEFQRVLDTYTENAVNSTETGKFDSWGTLSGEGRIYRVTFSDDEFELRHFLTPVNGVGYLEIQEWKNAYLTIFCERGFDLLEQSATFSLDTYGIADVQTAAEFKSELFQFDYPQNWIIDKERDDYNPNSFIPISAAPGAFCHIDLYPSESSLTEVFETTQNRIKAEAMSYDVKTWEPWVGFDGHAAQLILTDEEDRRIIVQTFAIEMGENTFLEWVSCCPVGMWDSMSPGIDLILKTLNVVGLDR